jgi:hypothetical protein
VPDDESTVEDVPGCAGDEARLGTGQIADGAGDVAGLTVVTECDQFARR